MDFAGPAARRNSSSSGGSSVGVVTIPAPPKTTIQAPSACPFSGVAIGPSMWESFQAKLASNDQRHHSADFRSFLQTSAGDNSKDDDGDQARPRSSELEATTERPLSPTRCLLKRRATNNFRVRVVNDTTKRSKDLVVECNGSETLFNAVYNHPSVKEAHVRKWGSQIAKEVKAGKSDIKVKIVVSRRNEDSGAPLFSQWFSLDSLKETTTGQLYEMVQEYENITSAFTEFYLVCLPKEGSHDVAVQNDAPTNKQKEARASEGQPKASEGQSESPSTETRCHLGRSDAREIHKEETSQPTLMSKPTCAAEAATKSYPAHANCSPQAGAFVAMATADEEKETAVEPPVKAFRRQSTTNTYRVRVVNQTTQRSKDMAVQGNGSESLFDAIYNHPSVKEAHIRKWGSQIAKDVKAGKSEIKVKVAVGESSGTDWHCWYTVEELKKVTTQQLYQIVQENQVSATSLTMFYLVCLPKGQSFELQDTANQVSPPLDSLEAPKGEVRGRQSPEERALTSANHSTARVASEDSSERVSTSQDVLALQRQSTNTTLDSAAQVSIVLQRQSTSTTINSEQKQNGSASLENESFHLNEMRCISVAASSNVDSTVLSNMSMSMIETDQHLGNTEHQHQQSRSHQPLVASVQDKVKTTLGVRVINQTTQRNKDLVVDISDTANVFDAVYNHPGVKSAHVRKWGGTIAKAVKAGTSEIKFSVWDDDTGKPWRVFAIDELKTTTTRQLYELVSESSNLIKIYLQCCSVDNTTNETTPVRPPPESSVCTNSTEATIKNGIGGAMKKDDDKEFKPRRNLARSSSYDDKYEYESVSSDVQSVVSFNPATPRRQKSLRLGKDGRPQHSIAPHHSMTPRRQASLRLEKHGRPQFSISSPDASGVGNSSPLHLTVKKPSRPNHMKLSAFIPRNGSCPTMQQLSMANGLNSRYESHDRLRGLLSRPLPFKVQELSPTAAGSKNATWETRRSGSHKRTLTSPNEFLSGVSKLTSTTKQQAAAGELKGCQSHIANQPLDTAAGHAAAPPSIVAEKQLSTSSSVGQGLPLLSSLPMRATQHPESNCSHHQKGSLTELLSSVEQPANKLSAEPQQCFTKVKEERAEGAPQTAVRVAEKPNLLEPLDLSESQEALDESHWTWSHDARDSPTKRRSAPTPQRQDNSLGSQATRRESATEQFRKILSNLKQSADAGNPTNATEQSTRSAARRGRRRLSNKKSLPRATSADGSSCASPSLIKPKGIKRRESDPSLGSKLAKGNQEKNQKIKEFMRLLRTKKLPEFQSQRSLCKRNRSNNVNSETIAKNEVQPAGTVPAIVETGSSADCSTQLAHSVYRQQQETHRSSVSVTSSGSNVSSTPVVRTPEDKINRFLRLNNSQNAQSKTNDKIARFLALQKSAKCKASEVESASQKKLSWSEADEVDQSVSLSTRKSLQNQFARCANGEQTKSLSGASGSTPSKLSDMPPVREISVIANGNEVPPEPVEVPGVSLSPDVVKEVFPYHCILDADFRVLQVGNSLELLIQESSLVGRTVSDLMTVTGPIPMFGQWDWSILEKMKDKTIFLETVLNPTMEEKVRLKGTIVEVSKSSKQVMLALFPNVKNLAELEEANLSMADLPLHSCQREAVLLGEHSKSEVNLTNHLDKLHRDLIDSMEQQIRDRTEELAAANRNLERANAQLAIQSARQLEHFACMSHEIRTPLNCIVGMSSLLLDDAEEMDPMHADSIRMINTSGDLLKAVVDDVLDYAKLESGSFEVDIKETSLQHTLDSVAHSISQKVKDKNVRLRLDYSPLLPEMVETDSRRLQQVLFNLLGNAGKFSKKNSVIDLTVSLVPVAQTEVDPDETSNGEVIRFAVKDYGKGIEEKDFKTIFEPFSQASKETQNLYGGTGLGLSITSKLVHRLGGTVSLMSEYGKYTEFTVDLPFRGKPVDAPKLQKRLRNTTIVLVEKETKYDYSFTKYPLKPEPIPFQESVANAYNLTVMRCNTLETVFERIKEEELATAGRHFALLVHEDLYQFGTFERLDEVLCRLDYTLMTFGSKYSVEMTKDRHFKCLRGVFPSSMLEAIAGHMERRKVEKMFCNRKLSILKSPESAKETAEHLVDLMKADTSSKRNLYAPLAVKSSEPPNVQASLPAQGLFAGLPVSNASTGGLFAGLPDNQSAPKQATGGLFASLPKSSSASHHPRGTLFAGVPSGNEKHQASGVTGAKPATGGLFAGLGNKQACTEGLFAGAPTSPTASKQPAGGLFACVQNIDHKQKELAGGVFPVTDASSQGQSKGLFATLNQTVAATPSMAEEKAQVPSPPAQKSATNSRKQQNASAARQAMKVLYAEDNLVNQKVLSRVLNRSGITNITIVDNGKKAVDICETETYDCIFMDIQMPVMGGMDATKIITERDPTAKVIFVTAHALDEFKAQADAVGGTSFISKPFRLSDIENLLKDLGY